MKHKHLTSLAIVAILSACVAIPTDRRRAENNCVKALYTAASGAQTWRQKCNRQGSSAPGCVALPAAAWIEGERARVDRRTCTTFYMAVGA